MRTLIIIAALLLAGCGPSPTVSTPEADDTILLYRKGEFKKVEVRKTGVYCTVAWFKTIDNFALRRDGTAEDNGFLYRWTLAEFGNEIDQKWFDKNCKEVK